jgi:UDP-N-acetylmuramyl pentapeptide phosphotransferase/UDP-N-acetylglucosamine-1-phosphate transferase
MILLRCISFLIGSLIVTGAPFLLLPEAPQRPSEVGAVLAACALVALMASGFLLIGVAGNHMKRSRRTRALGAILLSMPIIGGIAILLMEDAPPPEMWMIGPLLCFATFLFFGFVYPAKRTRSYRPMRPREQHSTLPSPVKG